MANLATHWCKDKVEKTHAQSIEQARESMQPEYVPRVHEIQAPAPGAQLKRSDSPVNDQQYIPFTGQDMVKSCNSTRPGLRA